MKAYRNSPYVTYSSAKELEGKTLQLGDAVTHLPYTARGQSFYDVTFTVMVPQERSDGFELTYARNSAEEIGFFKKSLKELTSMVMKMFNSKEETSTHAPKGLPDFPPSVVDVAPIIYRSSKKLEGCHTLKLEDILIFPSGEKYEVKTFGIGFALMHDFDGRECELMARENLEDLTKAVMERFTKKNNPPQRSSSN